MKRIIFLLSLIAFILSAGSAYAQKNKDRGPLLYFNYELHDGGDEVLSLRKYDSDGAVYFRFFGSLEGYTYYRISEDRIKEAIKIFDSFKLAKYPQTEYEKADKAKGCWILEVDFENKKYCIVEYNRNDKLRESVEKFFKDICEELKQMGEKAGEYSITEYTTSGHAIRTINYDERGCVKNGTDYREPDKCF